MSDGDSGFFLDKLRKIKVFQYLDDDALTEMMKIAEIVYYKKGDKIASEGEVSDYFFAVLEGTVNIVVTGADGREIFLRAVGESEVFGEDGIFARANRTADAVSFNRTTVFRVHRDGLMQFIKKRPSAGIKFLLVIIYGLVAKLRTANQEIASERKSSLQQDDIDSIVADFMTDS